jgi:hypothetical protein
MMDHSPAGSDPSWRHSAFLRGNSSFGSRDRAPNWLSSSYGVRCLRAFPVAVPRLSSPSLSAPNRYSGRPPSSLQRAAGLFPAARASVAGRKDPPSRSPHGLGQSPGKIRGEIRFVRRSEKCRDLHGLRHATRGPRVRRRRSRAALVVLNKTLGPSLALSGVSIL